jgi:hypothetical protein
MHFTLRGWNVAEKDVPLVVDAGAVARHVQYRDIASVAFRWP